MNCMSKNGLNVNSTINIYESKQEIARLRNEVENLKSMFESFIKANP